MAPTTPTLRNRALAHLARREYARLELRQKLLPHADGDEAALDAILDDLVARGWLSDERFAEQWAHFRSQRYGPQRLRAELRQKGVDDTLIDTALEGVADDEFAQARAQWQKKFGAPPQDAKERAKQARFLAGRGFSLDVVYRVIGGSDDDTD
ncbi:recombination regulator RecX [Jeongeupia chitinilytica]|uniref:Regulatory protein RecX n=1 Tax=Jeongeupia chitinilytica TaxID=1041641 RepID=A0ABQ3GW48_9NEIS|nr:recombination regulator RecX [Jeongeupia chitinilytica]GHD58047.1 regulatory protein RecX [Jeongeupia chitinilytica]